MGPVEEPQLSYFNTPGRVPLLSYTIGDLIDASAVKYQHKEAVVVPFQNIRKTFSDLKSEVDELAKGLLSLGLACGDRLAVWSPNTYESYISQLAGWKAGLIVVCINAALQRRELSYALNKVGARCIIISKPFRNQNFYRILSSVVPELSQSQPGYLKSLEVAELEFVISIEQNLPGTIPFQSLLERGRDYILGYQQDFPSLDFDDGCTIFFTSGTTGSPKAALASHHQLINNGNVVGRRILLLERDRICLPVPLFHGYGCQVGIFAALLHGATIVMPSYGYDPKAILKVSSDEKCTIIAGTPTMFSDIVKEDIKSLQVDLSSLRSAIAGGLMCSADLIKDLKSKLNFQHIFINYGMTETGCSYLGLPEDPDDILSSTVGFPCENIEVKCVDKTGKIVQVGTEGELCVRGYPVMKGYWGEPTSTAEVLEQSKWFHTGDLFVMSPSGHGRIVGRIKEMINRGGENLHPKEVEDFLMCHPKVKTAYVFGIPDARMGEVPAAWLELEDGENVTPDEIISFCREQISHFKIPKHILFKAEFPHTPMGKPQKFKMREETIKFLKL